MLDDTDEFDSVVGSNTGDKELIRRVVTELLKQEAQKEKEKGDIYIQIDVIYAPYVPYCLFRYTYPIL
jgi:hypothetical protein